MRMDELGQSLSKEEFTKVNLNLEKNNGYVFAR